MGGTSWEYLTPYQPDIEQALQKLRNEVFRRQEFPFEFESAFDATPAAWAAIKKWNTNRRRQLLAYKNVRTIDDLLEVAGYSGTHSILDVRHVSDRKVSADDFYVVIPASLSDLIKWFSTDKPTRNMLDASWEYENRFDWYPIYFVVYKDGLPDEICFAGVTGD